MVFSKNPRIFQHTTMAILVVFIGIMVIVTFVAYNRRSGYTGMDMGQIQKVRYEASSTKDQLSENDRILGLSENKQ